MKFFLSIIFTLVSIVAHSQEECTTFAHQDKIDQQVIPEDSTVRKGILAQSRISSRQESSSQVLSAGI